MKQKILVFSPHPDDAEFGCGGVLIKEVLKGNKVYIVHLSKGEMGSFGTPSKRAKELQESAKIIGAKVEFLELGGDCHIEYSIANKIKIAKKIREIQPEVVLSSHTDENQHPDHSAAGKLVRDACRLARYGGLKELKKNSVHAIKALYFYAVTVSPTALPDIIIDVSDVFERWVKAMKCYQTQVRKKKYLELQKSKARYFGLLNDVEYGIGLWTSAPISLNSITELRTSARGF